MSTDKPHEPPTKEQELQTQVDDYKQLLQRLQADFENYRKRTEHEQENYAKYATQTFISQLLEVLDDFELALKHKESNAFRDGIELTYAKLITLLEKQGLKKIPTQGTFNPEHHEALIQEPSEQPAGTIIEELQAGYTLHQKTIRTAKVKLSKGEK